MKKDRVFTIRTIIWLSFLAGPFTGLTAVAHNARIFKNQEQAVVSYFLALVSVLLLFLIPDSILNTAVSTITFSVVLYLLSAVLIGFYAAKTQEHHIAAGPSANRYKTFWQSLIFGLVSIGMWFVVAFLLLMFADAILPAA